MFNSKPTPAGRQNTMTDASNLQREAALKTWIDQYYPESSQTLAPASADASFRSYYRIQTPNGSKIVMDAPPALENSTPFVEIGRQLAASDVLVPHIEQVDLAQGFMLLSDLGNTHYQDILSSESARVLYEDAWNALIKMQKLDASQLPKFSPSHMAMEMDLFDEWFVGVHLKATLTVRHRQWLKEVKLALINNLSNQPQVFMHRDFHCRNLMFAANNNPAVIDFQGAMEGPISYDLASLLKDAYIDWSEEELLDWTIRYWASARKAGLPLSSDFDSFYQDFEWAGVQRHLKVVGIFARLAHRDNKPNYLNDLPRVLNYLEKTTRRYRALAPIAKILDDLQDKSVQVGYTF
ncbi:phosphotransferase [Leeia sp. TBRC 13508]|uniref:Phosphotransferase n=1 Tax=Leeia speluncae TaxID=2884804 RepID=A0ABS8D5J2_9NEIS|nr:phosphotransferase [Leeia speluncae]MCB6183442.1 phosphotransferase [Leeia speluncae]